MPKVTYSKDVTGVILPIKGLDSTNPAEFISEGQSPDNQNMEVVGSILTKRTGATALGGQHSETIIMGMELIRKGEKYVFRMGGTSLQYLDPILSGSIIIGHDWQDVILSGCVLTADDTYPVTMATPMLEGARVLTVSNLKDVIIKCTGETMVAEILAGSPPKAKFMVDYNAYLVLAHVVNETIPNGQRVVWCDTGNPQNWTTGNAKAKDLIEGGDITGMTRYGNYITIHKLDAIYLGYLVSTSEVFRFERRPTIGTIVGYSIQELPSGEQIYLAQDGVRLFNGSTSQLIPSAVNDDIKKNINGAHYDKCWSVIVPEKNEYWLGIPYKDQTSPDTIFKYNYVSKVSYKDTRSDMACAFQYSKANSTFNGILLGTTDGYTYEIDNTLNDGGEAIDSYWDSKDFTPDEYEIFARWTQLDLVAKGHSVNIYFSVDSGDSWTLIGEFALNENYPTDIDPIKVWFDAVSTKIRFRFENTKYGESFAIKQFLLYFKKREPV